MAIAITAMMLAGLLLRMSMIDVRELRIPNGHNLMLAVLGVTWTGYSSPDALLSHLIGAGFVFGVALLGRQWHRLATGRVGLGLGDVKMIGASALWLSPTLFPVLLLVASTSALIFVALCAWYEGGWERNRRLPFGPFIAGGLLFTSALQEALL